MSANENAVTDTEDNVDEIWATPSKSDKECADNIVENGSHNDQSDITQTNLLHVFNEVDTASLGSISYKSANGGSDNDSLPLDQNSKPNEEQKELDDAVNTVVNPTGLKKEEDILLMDQNDKSCISKTIEASESDDVQFMGHMDANSGELITNVDEIFEFVAKMPDVNIDDQNETKFPIPMNSDGVVSTIILDTSCDINQMNDKNKFEVVELSTDNGINQQTIEPTLKTDPINGDIRVEFIADEDEDSTQYEDIQIETQPSNTVTTVNTAYDMKDKNINTNDDDDDFIEETWSERLWGLTEMFPESFVDGTIRQLNSIRSITSSVFTQSKNVLWVTASALVVVVFPVVLGVEIIRMEETQLAQQRQMLVNSGVLNTQPGSLEPSPIPN